MVGLHVLHNEIIGTATAKRSGKFLLPLLATAGVHGVHYGYLFVDDYIRIVAHTFGQIILTLKLLYFKIFTTDVSNVVGDGAVKFD